MVPHKCIGSASAVLVTAIVMFALSCSDNPVNPEPGPNPTPPNPLNCAILQGSPASGAAPYVVHLSAEVSGGVEPYSYAWDFDDGTTATTRNPNHLFVSPGSYDVSLTVTDADATVCSHGTTFTVSDTASHGLADLRPSGSFTILPASLHAGDSVTVGNIGISNSGEVACQAFRVGIYLSSDTIPDVGTSTDVTLLEQSFSQGLTVGQTLALGEKKLRIPSGTIAGSYHIILMVDCRRVISESNEANNIVYSPLAVTAAGTLPDLVVEIGRPMFNPGTVQPGGTTHMSAISVRNAGTGSAGASRCGMYLSTDSTVTVADILLATQAVPALNAGQRYSFGDTSVTVPGGLPAGHYYVGVIADDQHRVTESNEQNNIAYDEVTVSSTILALHCTVTPSPATGTAPLTVRFTANVTGGRAPYSYRWQFGDGYTSTLAAPSHTFQLAGTYAVNLTVTDADQRTAGSMIPLTVSAVPALTAYASATPTSGTVPLAVEFVASAGNGVGPYSYSWSFGDGGSVTGPVVSHTYTSAGTYRAVLTVTDSQSHTARDTVLITASAPATPLTCNLTASTTSGVAALIVAFNGSMAGGQSPYSVSLAFGDGASATSLPVSHSYTTAGTYRAILTVTDAASQTAKDTVVITVIPPFSQPLTCSLNANPTSGSAPLAVGFTGSASGGLGAYSYLLRFGDGSSTSNSSASHTYSSAGDYWAVLTVTDGQSHTARDSVRISVSSGSSLGTPTGLVADIYSGQIRLRWNDNASGETGYQIQASLSASFSSSDSFNTAANAVTYYFSQYSPGTTYYFRVRAVSGSTYSAFSNTADITTPNTVTSYATAANSVASASNDANTANLVYRDGQIFVGCKFTNFYEWTDIFNTLGALRFDNLQSMISGRSISSAVLRLYPSLCPVQNDTYYWVAALAGAWNPNTLTYNNTPNWYTGGQSSARPPVSSVQYVEFNVTTIVRNWANGTFSNYGLIIYDQAALNPYPSSNIDRITQFESEDDYSNPDRRPHIIVTFQ
ncbi:PKD domain-containing protein [bacterium]|nr:PKD domain-containing protein [bacterium]